jgi:anti-sigma regulatory factor (Ser/Thr protein kinase)
LTKLFGLRGFEISMIVGAVVLLFFCIAVPWLKNRRFPKTMEDMIMLPEDFGPSSDAVYAASIETMDDVMRASREIQTFCRERETSTRLAGLASLFVEEITKNTVTYGFQKQQHGSVDLRLVIYEDKKVIRFRDNGMPFNPVEWFERNHPEDPASGIGIRMIVAMAKDVNYVSAVGWNNLMITL